ncbi:hypothetical protein GCM10011380_18580 [Sphingomonas metalli]|uniref:DUF4189 domain-containing protein n=1 Tax=Sphingomonas metalli TaxID=1779358 RepID=A0A916WTW5_9SPHN|nr:DUF4189 domain-containing protein [Sphingomonas metalli]GGB29352.1 hypothetical protein GCM10011380_18580 [Sphingomonas metalli]
MTARSFWLAIAAAIVIGGTWFGWRSQAVAQMPTVFICNGVPQGGPNCPPPTPVLKNFVRVDKSFGALAYDAAKALWYGSYQYPSRKDAQQGAIGHCRENGGTDCRLMLSYTNQCAAVARAVNGKQEVPGNDTVDTGSTQEEAEAHVRQACERDWSTKTCVVKLVNCSHHGVTRWQQWVYE